MSDEHAVPEHAVAVRMTWVPNALELAMARAALASSFSELDALCYSVELAIEPTQASSNIVALPASASGKLLLWMTRLEDALEDCPRSSVLQSYLIKTRLAHERVMQLEQAAHATTDAFPSSPNDLKVETMEHFFSMPMLLKRALRPL